MIENASALIALAMVAIVSSITPGPNNFMVMASSAAFGWQRAMPHIAGITIGFAIMISAVVLGLGVVLKTYPQIVTFVRISGAAWFF
jgi:threonine/homoserine/homoserine lactone efflux protein